MTQDVQQAIHMMYLLAKQINPYSYHGDFKGDLGCKILYRAIHHLAYPDRNIYPKTRRGTKGAPIVRR